MEISEWPIFHEEGHFVSKLTKKLSQGPGSLGFYIFVYGVCPSVRMYMRIIGKNRLCGFFCENENRFLMINVLCCGSCKYVS